MNFKKTSYVEIGIGIFLIFIASILGPIYSLSTESQITDFFGVIFLTFGFIKLIQEKDKEFFNKIGSHYILKSIFIIVLCFLVIVFNFFKFPSDIILAFFSITVMLFLFTKLFYGKDKGNRQLEIYIDTKSIVTGVQILLIVIFVSFYGYTFYNLWFSKSNLDPIIFTFIYLIVAFMLLIESLKIFFIKMYQ